MLKTTRYFIFLGSFSAFLMMNLPQDIVYAVNPLIMRGESQKTNSSNNSDVSQAVKKELQSNFGNYIVIESGVVKAGRQIPLPSYQDGTQAKREECKYMVSTNEFPTAITYTTTSGSFYVKAVVDKDGYAHASLWLQSGLGDGVMVVGENTYEEVKKESQGYSSTNTGPTIVEQQMKALSEHLTLNYMVIAVRSSDNS